MSALKKMDLRETIKLLDSRVSAGRYPWIKMITKEGTCVVPAVKPDRKNPNKIHQHWEFIKERIFNELPPGQYVIECCYDIARSNKTHYPIVIPDNWDDFKQDPSVHEFSYTPAPMPAMDMDEYKKMLQKISSLEKDKHILMMELETERKRNSELLSEIAELKEEHEELADPAPDIMDKIEKGLTAAKPAFLALESLAERWFGLQEQKMALEAQKMQFQLPKQTPKPKPRMQQQQPENLLQKSVAYFSSIKDEDRLNAELDELEKADPDLYLKVCDQLGFDLEGDETDE